MIAELFRWLSIDPVRIRWIAWTFIGGYYLLSLVYIAAAKTGGGSRIFKKDGWLDRATSLYWLVFAVSLIGCLYSLAARSKLSLPILIEYYVFFIFLFAFLYGLIKWHRETWIDGIRSTEYEAEIQYLILSVSMQTTSGIGRAKPAHWVVEVIGSLQTLLGIGFVVVIVAIAVNKAA